MRNQAKPFLRNAVIMTIAAAVIALLLQSWGAVQVIIVILVALLAAGQWALYFYMRKH